MVVAESRGPGTQNALVVTRILHTVPGPGTSCLRTPSSETRRPRGGPAAVGGRWDPGRTVQVHNPHGSAWAPSWLPGLRPGPAAGQLCGLEQAALLCASPSGKQGGAGPPQRAPGMGHGRSCAADLSGCHQASSLVQLLTPFCADWSVRTAATCGLWSAVAMAWLQGRGSSVSCSAQAFAGRWEVWGGFCLCYRSVTCLQRSAHPGSLGGFSTPHPPTDQFPVKKQNVW